MRLPGVLSAVLVLGIGPVPAFADDPGTAANSVVVWDLYAQNAIWDVAQQAPQVTGRSFAIVHGAVYDAVNAIAGTPYQPYLIAPRASGGESVDAAVATAAYRTLVFLFPEQQSRLTAQYDQYLAGIADSAAKGWRAHRRPGRGGDRRGTAQRRRLRPAAVGGRHRAGAVAADPAGVRLGRGVGRARAAVHDCQRVGLPHRRTARTHQPGVRR
jgi:hypothetical protein